MIVAENLLFAMDFSEEINKALFNKCGCPMRLIYFNADHNNNQYRGQWFLFMSCDQSILVNYLTYLSSHLLTDLHTIGKYQRSVKDMVADSFPD